MNEQEMKPVEDGIDCPYLDEPMSAILGFTEKNCCEGTPVKDGSKDQDFKLFEKSALDEPKKIMSCRQQ